jgi:hypothetical protein
MPQDFITERAVPFAGRIGRDKVESVVASLLDKEAEAGKDLLSCNTSQYLRLMRF